MPLIGGANRRAYICGADGTGQLCLKRRWLLIDADPVRISGMSSTDAEREKAREVVDRVRKELTTNGWPVPVVADSGNGYHLLYRIDLPADDQGLVKRVLTALAARFDTEQVKIDQKVYNPGRIVKLYGTLARKGSNVPQRPHRTSQVLDVPIKIEVVPQELLEALAAEVPEQPPRLNPAVATNNKTRGTARCCAP